MNTKKYAAEAIGTFWLTFAGCGSAVIAVGLRQVVSACSKVALTFGLKRHHGLCDGPPFNPAVTVGLAAADGFPAQHVISQVIGAVVAAALLYVIASGAPGFDLAKGFSNGYGEHSPGQYNMMVCFITELWPTTMMFLFIIMGATHGRRLVCAARHRILRW